MPPMISAQSAKLKDTQSEIALQSGQRLSELAT
jgi:hypothetical protein